MSTARTAQKTLRACALEAYGGAERMRLIHLPLSETRDMLIPMDSAEVREWEPLARDGAAAPFPSVTHMQQRERERRNEFGQDCGRFLGGGLAGATGRGCDRPIRGRRLHPYDGRRRHCDEGQLQRVGDAVVGKVADLEFEVVETFQNEDGSHVASCWQVTGKNNGVLGMPADQRPIDFTGTAIWAVREDGKLLHNWVERSWWELFQRLNTT
jgi:hypothetical protein